MRWIGITVIVLVTSVAVGGASAANRIGTPGNDVLRGTAAADRIYGKAGNDTLIGLGGDDYLNGGPGRDRFSCGNGVDKVIAQVGEKVAADCEKVTRLASDPVVQPPTPKPPAPTPPPPPPAPPRVAVQGGPYCGYTQQGPGICVTVAADGLDVTELATSAIVDCPNTGYRWEWRLTFGGRTVPVAADGTFSYLFDGVLSYSGSDSITDITAKYTINGTFAADGTAKGTVAIESLNFTESGKRHICSQTPVTWSAKKQ